MIGAIEQLETVVLLLEQTMKITDKQELPTSCKWLDGMIWNAEEKWFQKNNDPDEAEERAIYIDTDINGMATCYLIFPSTYYDDISGFKDCIRSLPEYHNLLERVKKLIEKSPQARRI